MRKLAEQTGAATLVIQESIQDIQHQVKQATDKTTATLDRYNAGTERLDSVTQGITALSDMTATLKASLANVLFNVEAMKNGQQKVNESVLTVTGIQSRQRRQPRKSRQPSMRLAAMSIILLPKPSK